MELCKRKGVMCECLTDHSVFNTSNCHRKLSDIEFTSEEVKHSLEDVGIELVDGELNMEKPKFFSDVLTAKDVKNFLKYIPDHAEVVFTKGCITCLFDGNARALNKWKAIWDNGIGYPRTGISCCGECSHFECDLCNIFRLEY